MPRKKSEKSRSAIQSGNDKNLEIVPIRNFEPSSRSLFIPGWSRLCGEEETIRKVYSLVENWASHLARCTESAIPITKIRLATNFLVFGMSTFEVDYELRPFHFPASDTVENTKFNTLSEKHCVS